jgi:hypothetical protein
MPDKESKQIMKICTRYASRLPRLQDITWDQQVFAEIGRSRPRQGGDIQLEFDIDDWVEEPLWTEFRDPTL